MPDVPDARTLPRLFETSVERHANRVFLLEKRGGRYEGTTYAAMRAIVHRFAAGLLSLGLAKGDRVALIAEGRNDWVMAELGILYCGAINVPISVKIDELGDLAFRLSHAGCRMAIVSQGQVEKIRAIRRDLPDLQQTIVLDPIEDAQRRRVRRRPRCWRRGARSWRIGRAAFDARWQSVAESDAANICYTSGTTADPKGIVLTHRNYTANVEQGWRHRAAGARLGAAEHPAVGPRLRPHVRHLHDDEQRRRAGVGPGRAARRWRRCRTCRSTSARRGRPSCSACRRWRRTSARTSRRASARRGRRAEALFARALRSAYAYNGEGWNRGARAPGAPEAAAARALRPHPVHEDPRELRRPAAVLRRRRRAARHRTAALLLRHRHPDAAGLRPHGGRACHLRKHARAPQAGIVRARPAGPGRADLRRRRAARCPPARAARSSSAART